MATEQRGSPQLDRGASGPAAHRHGPQRVGFVAGVVGVRWRNEVDAKAVDRPGGPGFRLRNPTLPLDATDRLP